MCFKAATVRCLKQGHIAFCEVCTYQFNVKSRGGCSSHPYSEGHNRAALACLRGFVPNFNPVDEPDLEIDAQAQASQVATTNATPRKIEGAYNEAWKKVGEPEYKEKRTKTAPQESVNKKRGRNV